jgi:hypothetical protein
MNHFWRLLVKAAVVLLGLSSVLQAQQTGSGNGPQFCPPLNEFLTPTLLDALIYPGISFV